MGGILCLLWLFMFFIMYGYGCLSRGFTDQREILRGGTATSQTGFLPFWGDSLRDVRISGMNMRRGSIFENSQ